MDTVFRMVAHCHVLDRKHIFSGDESREDIGVLRDKAKIALRCHFCDLYEADEKSAGVCRALKVRYSPVKRDGRGYGG